MEFSDIEDISDEEYSIVPLQRRKIIRLRPNNINVWNDVDFYKRFRLTKQSAFQVLEEIHNHIKHKTARNSALSPQAMLLLTLRYYASGGMIIAVDDCSGVSKRTALGVINMVSHHIALLSGKYILMPRTKREEVKTIADFFDVAKFPRTIAALGCTHVRILSQEIVNWNIFRNSKGFFSLNVQTLCDSKLKILDIVARWPGSNHDSSIFDKSKICSRFESGEFKQNVILADTGYPCRNYMLTPLRTCLRPEENLYNESQRRTRDCVERLYRVWKQRFPILATGIRLKTKTIQNIIIATAVLHNICCLNNEMDSPPLDEITIEQIDDVNSVKSGLPMIRDIDTSTRDDLIDNYFKNMQQN